MDSRKSHYRMATAPKTAAPTRPQPAVAIAAAAPVELAVATVADEEPVFEAVLEPEEEALELPLEAR